MINMIRRKDFWLKDENMIVVEGKINIEPVNFYLFLPSPISCIFHSFHSLLTADTHGNISNVTGCPRAMETENMISCFICTYIFSPTF